MIRLKQGGVRWTARVEFASQLAAVLASPGRVVKEGPAKLLTAHDVFGARFYVKRYRNAWAPLRPLKYALFRRSQARREWEAAQAIEARAVPVVRHLAFGERWSVRGLEESIVVTEGFEGVPLSDASHDDWHAVLAFVERMHARGVLPGDLHAANLLVRPGSDEIRLVDVYPVAIKDRLTPAERSASLAQLRVSLPIPVPLEVDRESARLRRRLVRRHAAGCLREGSQFGLERAGGLRWQVRRCFAGAALDEILRDADGFLARAEVLKAGRTATVARGGGFVVKRFARKKPENLVKDLFRASRARRAYRRAYHLELLGIAAPRSVAVAERRVLRVLVRSYLVMEEVRPACELGRYLAACGRPARAVVVGLGDLVGRLHDAGLAHGDLRERNLLVDEATGACHVLDVDGLADLGRVPEARAAADLMRLARAVAPYLGAGRGERITFLRAYCRARGVRCVPRPAALVLMRRASRPAG